MKRKRCVALLLGALVALSALSALHAQETETQKSEESRFSRFLRHCSADFSVGAGVVSNWIHEYIYYEDGDVMSRLDWNAPFVPCVALSGEVSVFHAVLGADFLIAVPVKCGTMEDWDYLKSDHSRATNFSQSDLITNKHYEVEIKGGYEFLYKNFRILPEIGFHYRNQKMEATGGYLQYGSLDPSYGGYWSEDLKKYDLVGTEIQYKRVSLSLSYAYTECTDGESSQRNFGHTTYLSDSDSKPSTKEKTLTFLVTYHIQ